VSRLGFRLRHDVGAAPLLGGRRVVARDTLEREIEAIEQCSVASAQRVIRFWRVREAAMRQQAG
jgi:hypothetical protein